MVIVCLMVIGVGVVCVVGVVSMVDSRRDRGSIWDMGGWY